MYYRPAPPTALQAPHTSIREPNTLSLFGLKLINETMTATLDFLCARLALKVKTRVAFLNAHCVNVAAHDPAYRAALGSADAILPDGSGIAVAAAMQRKRIVQNLNGTDLVPALCRRLANEDHSVFLLGGRPGVAATAAANLRRAIPDLAIAGTHDGYFAAAQEDEIISRINASGAAVVLVAMGVPMQDLWLHRVADRLRAPLTLGVGGLFDFLAQRVSRAPKPLRRTGMEWTWRLYQEPSRMWRRYILGNPAFMLRAAADALPMRDQVDLAAKRAMDIAGATFGLLFLSPVLLGAAALVKLTTQGPALLRQTRIGKDGKPFGLFKFRSMYVDADARRVALEAQNQHGADGITFKLRRDPRVTPVGRWLRKSSLDELPQLWNVLKGDMSLVGPRPPLPHEVARYTPAHRRRLEAKPGLTCLWQVSGRADLPFERQVALDIEYLGKRSVLLDIAILLRTIPAVVTARGAY
jgi:exopolysaccharide biosynthesis WecB/TagA/CpsF family protein